MILDHQLTADLRRGMQSELSSFAPDDDLYTRMNYRRALQDIASNPHAFDGPMAGIASYHPGVIEFHAGRYRDYLALDMLDVVDRRPFDQTDLALLPDYGEAVLFGAVGISVLALTLDDCAVLVEQTRANSHFTGRWGPTGSGTLEPSDVQVGADPLTFLAEAAAREAREEAGLNIRPEDLEFKAAGRWWEKASKPEFYFVTRLGLTSDEISRKPSGEVFSGRVLPVPVDHLAQLTDASASLLFTAAACELGAALSSQML